MTDSPNAPRFHAYFQHVEGQPVLTMGREEWDSLVKQPGEEVAIDVTATPMGRVATAACVTACVAQSYFGGDPNAGDGLVEVYRRDPADGSTPINKDTYKVWLGETLRNQPNFEEMVLMAATAPDANLYKDLDENVFIVKDKPGHDHWLPEVPNTVKVLRQQE